jgi:ribulose-5-phosphate 4-epimerase/fuculose-1-phosphate aldolase
METVCWDRKGMLMVEFMQQGTAMSEVYCKTLKKLHKAIQNRRHGMLTCGVVARPHAAARTLVLLEHFIWKLFHHLPYSP